MPMPEMTSAIARDQHQHHREDRGDAARGGLQDLGQVLDRITRALAMAAFEYTRTVVVSGSTSAPLRACTYIGSMRSTCEKSFKSGDRDQDVLAAQFRKSEGLDLFAERADDGELKAVRFDGVAHRGLRAAE